MPGRISEMNYASLGRGSIALTRESADALDEYIAWCENVSKRKLRQADDWLARYLAIVSGAYAQKYSAGMQRAPEDQSRSWSMPVPRVTGRYWASWRIQRVGTATWILTNDSREAYYIEYGIHRNPRTGQVAARRIRRPVFKLSFLRTLEWIRETNLTHRVWSDVLIPKNGEPGRRNRNLTWYSQPSGVMGGYHMITGRYGTNFTTLGGVRRARRKGRGAGRGFNVIHVQEKPSKLP